MILNVSYLVANILYKYVYKFKILILKFCSLDQFDFDFPMIW